MPFGSPSLGDVLLGYHAAMAHFLETQRAVMLGYLDAVGAASVPARPANGRSRSDRRRSGRLERSPGDPVSACSDSRGSGPT